MEMKVLNQHWMDAEASDTDECARLVLAGAQTVQEAQEGIREMWRQWTVQYHERGLSGFEPNDWQRLDETHLLDDDPAVLPVTRQIVDTIVSKITVHSPRPRFLPGGASEGVLERARLMEKAVTAVLRQNEAWALGASALRDSGICGTGCMVVDSLDGKIRIRRMHPSRVLIDDRACLDSREPYEAYCIEFVPLRELKRRYPDADLDEVKADGPPELELVRVITAWCADGERAVACEGALLERGPWKGPVPVIPITWHEDTMGWHGTGAAEVVQGIHNEINTLSMKAQANIDMLSVPYILKEKGSDVEDEHLLSNEMARLIEYVGTPPQVMTPPGISPQVLELMDRYYAKAFETEGVSMLSAAARKPEGLNSGVAIRTYMDIESQRLTEIQKRWEKMYVQIAQQIVREAARVGSSWTVLAAAGGRAEKIKWSDAVLAEGEYVVQVWPASSLPQSPAGRLERVIEMLNSGMVDSLEARTLLDWPDLEKSDMLAAAERDDLHRMFEKFLDGEPYEPPLEQQDLKAGILLGRRYWLRGRLEGVPEERLHTVEQWMREAAEIVQAAITPPEAPQGPFPPQAELPAA